MNSVKVNVTNNTNSVVQVTKSDDEKNIFIHVNDLPKEPESKERPAVSDEAITSTESLSVGESVIYTHREGGECLSNIIGIHKDFVWLELDQPLKPKLSFKLGNIHCSIKKPPTPEEELATKLIEKYKHLDKREQAFAIARDIIDDAISKFSIKPR